MRVLVSWLRDFVDVPGTPEDIAATMSVRGFAVEGIERIGADAVLDFEITANRPDCMSVTGIAREVATAYALDLRAPSPAGPGEAGPAGIGVVIEAPDLCPRYAATVADVTVRPSPDWMQARLRAAGVRPISSIVDVTNYVLLEMGQPMHAFDLATLGGPEIRVRRARPGESLRTLDGQTRSLNPDMLVIADASRAVAVAGVMGGAETEVTGRTNAIVLESAYFNPLSVRRTSKALGLKTEASMRFERGTDPQLPVLAMERACALLETIGTGRPRGIVVDQHPALPQPIQVRLRRERITGLLGMSVPDADIRRILEGLGFTLRDAGNGWDVTIPTWRVDCRREVDLIEEVARHYGFDRLPATFPALGTAPAPMDPRIARTRQLRSVLTAAGFSEAVTFGFIAQPAAARFAPDDELVPIANPLSETFAVLRPSILPGVIDAASHNRRREQRDVRLFEIGNLFSRTAGERRSVAFVWAGTAGEHWSARSREVDFFDVKAVVERIGDAMRVELTTETRDEKWLVRGRSAAIMCEGRQVGAIGQLAPAVADAHGLPSGDAVYVAQLDLDALERAAPERALTVQALPRYPSVTRDISVLIDETLSAARVRQTIRDVAPATLVDIFEFDRYQGKGVPEGRVSLSLRLVFRSSDRTLTDSEVQTAMEGVIGALQERHGATQR